MENTADKTIITVVGKDTVGIIAKVCTYLSENGVNVLDISQTIVSGYFNMQKLYGGGGYGGTEKGNRAQDITDKMVAGGIQAVWNFPL